MYQSCGVNNPVTKLLKVHWHWLYVHIIFHESPKWKDSGCQIGWSGWPWNVAATTYPSSCEFRQLGSGFFDPRVIRLWRFTFPDKWKVASSLETILSKNKLYSLRQFSISVQNFLRCGRSLSFNSCSSLNLYGRKDSLIRSTLHTVMWEISPSSLLDRCTWTKHSRKDGLVVAATFHGHPDRPMWHPRTFHFGGSWKIMCAYHPCQCTFKSFVTGLLTP
jgi:hypothetical protein